MPEHRSDGMAKFHGPDEKPEKFDKNPDWDTASKIQNFQL